MRQQNIATFLLATILLRKGAETIMGPICFFWVREIPQPAGKQHVIPHKKLTATS
jgi:hypothetical protein